MQERQGERVGSLLHLVSYTLAPIILVVVMIIAAQRGVTLSQFFAG